MSSGDRLRTRIAVEAARLMADEGVEEIGLAKKKAADRLGLADCRNLPRNEEIEAALIEHHRLFGDVEQPRQLARLRKLALEAMRFLVDFSPILVGAVWNGSAGRFSPIRLHLFPDTPEEVMRKLWNARIPFEEKSHALPRDGEFPAELPALHFYVDDVRVELLLFPPAWKNRSLRKKGNQPVAGNLRDLIKRMESEYPFP